MWLDGALTTLAFCWRLERRDGITLGFISHDRDLVIDGLTYRAAPGMLPSAIARSDGFEVDSMDMTGALSDAAISAQDLAAGRWDGARVALFAVDWEAPDNRLPLARGELGSVELVDERFTAELRGPTAVLERPVVEQTSPECRAELGDRRCRVDLAARRDVAVVVSADDAELVFDRIEPVANAYGYGVLRWISGANSGLSAAILASSGAGVTLREDPAFAVAAGDRAELIQGCDKRFATCGERFANRLNFRGEPHLPGNDLLTRYPGG
ncbi:DUF2163 domain-containing protein [Sphingomonas cavernae]|uniref:DUF2163 domain-containing protein n=1 Tax=Sphingomonas cavernae TaxID=2320861 RepID=A0A418WL66_9SPHN|nr:DUF2163 domain-containing protein [Sphingomonas cavernae]RJF90791.1 DUF2163 domain-containing protein [Sphingomonas cavernae]